MKKLITLLSFIVVCSFSTVMAQPPAGGGGMMDPAAMKARQLKMLKDSDLKLTDVQADSVVSINMEFMGQMRGLRDLSDDERQAKIKEVNDAKLKRWTSALQDESLAKKVAEFYQKQRRNGPGGGTPPPPPPSNK